MVKIRLQAAFQFKTILSLACLLAYVSTGFSQAIGVTAVSGASPYCAGTSVSITFTISGTFSNTPTANVFTAQLSDITGSFSAPVSIGTRTAVTAGTITCSIPFSTATGSLYRIRVISSNPAVFGSDNGYNFTVNAPTVSSPTITNTSFCQEEVFTVNFTQTCNFTNTPSANVYTAQLSDASGSFASPVAIGTRTATTAASFTAAIPPGTAAGAGYRVRIVSSDPAVTGPDNGTNLAVNASAGTPSVFGNGAWEVYCYNAFNNFALDYQGNYTESSLSFDTRNRWSSTASPSSANAIGGSAFSGCPFGNTNYSIACKRTNIPCGYYQIDIPAHDDYVYLLINGITVYQHISCCDAHTNVWTGFIDPTQTVEIRLTNGSGPGYLAVNFTPLNPLLVSAPVTICQGSSTSLVASASGTVAFGYSWSPAASLASATSATATATPSATTIYTVLATDVATGCTETNTVTVTINPLPTTTVASTSTLLCSGLNTATLTSGGANSYTWSPSAGLSATSGNSVIANPTVTTTYTVSGSNNCAILNALTTVSVQTIPASPATTAFGNGTWNVYCNNNTTFSNYFGYYTENSLSFNTSNRWNSANGPSTCTTSATGLPYSGCSFGGTYWSMSFKRTGIPCGYYQVDLPSHDDIFYLYIDGVQTYTSAYTGTPLTNAWSGFIGPATTVEIRLVNNSGPGAVAVNFVNISYPVLSPPVTICAGTSTSLTANYIAGATYSWTPGTGLSTTTGTLTVASPGASNAYTCTVIDPVTTCSASASVSVTINPLPTTAVSPTIATVACASNTYILNATGANTYTWAPSSGLSATSGYSVVASPTVTTTYTVTGNNNCASADATTTITVVPLASPATFPSNTWNVYCYNDLAFSNYYGYYTENGSGASGYNFNTSTRYSSVTPIPSNANSTNGLPYTGCTLPATNWSASYKRTGFACGTYSVSVLHDDYFYLFVNGVQVAQHTTAGGDTHNGVWTGVLNASSTVEFRLVQITSSSVLSVTMALVAPAAGLSTWIGGTSTDWFTASNWCGSGVPTYTNDVLIPAAGPQYMPVIGAAGAQCKSITIGPATAAGTYNNAIPSASLSVSGANGLDVYGNWNDGGVFGAGTGTVNFLGSTNTTFSCAATYTETFYNLVINKTGAATVTGTAGTHQVSGNLNFINGVVYQNAVLQVLAGASVSGQSNVSYIDGPVYKFGNTAFTFPTGTGGLYRPISISAPALVTDNFVAQYFIADPHPTYNVSLKDPALDHISRCEYWILNRSAGVTANVNVTLTWNTNSCGVTNLADLRVARWDAGQVKWKDQGNGGTTGNFTAGTVITSAPVTNFSPFTLSSATINNPLPIGLKNFECRSAGHDAVELVWATASEINNDYFTVERSEDAISYQVVGTVKGAGNSTQELHYSLKDQSPVRGINYYRLKQTDFDGHFKYSEVCSVSGQPVNGIKVYPNPASLLLTIEYEEAGTGRDLLTITDLLGNSLHLPVAGAGDRITVDVSALPPGIYFIELPVGNKKMIQKVTIQR